MRRYIVLLAFFTVITTALNGQAPAGIFTPRVGDTLPEYTFTDLRNFDKETLTLSELRGKWLIMDFWSKDCSGCVKSLPKMSKLQEQYKDNVSILMVGKMNSYSINGEVVEVEKLTKALYNRLDSIYDFNFITSFDTVLYDAYGLYGLPYILIVDPAGVVRGITNLVNESIIEDFLNGKTPRLYRAYTGYERQALENVYNEIEAQPEAELSDRDTVTIQNLALQTSKISLYDERTMRAKWLMDLNDPHSNITKKVLETGIFEVAKLPFKDLFYLAYFGVTGWGSGYHQKFYWEDYSKAFVLETSDSSKFLTSSMDRYAYKLVLPKDKVKKEVFMKIMQRDLEEYFGFKGVVERRPAPVYNLVVNDRKKAEKLKTQGATDRYLYDKATTPRVHMILNNSSVELLCNRLGGYLNERIPIVDMTGFKENIDIHLRGYLYDDNEMERALAEYGLKLEKGFKEMYTIVIRDSETFVSNR